MPSDLWRFLPLAVFLTCLAEMVLLPTRFFLVSAISILLSNQAEDTCGAATNRLCSSLLSATPLAKLKPLTTMRVALAAGSYSRMRPVEARSMMSSTAASNVPPHCAGPKRADASLK